MHKKAFLIALLVLVMAAGASPAWAKSKSKKAKSVSFESTESESASQENGIDQDITLEPLGFVFGAGTLEYEHLLNRNSSWAAGLKFGGMTIGDWRYGAFGVEGAYRFFPLTKFQAPRGLWFGPAVEIMNYSWTYAYAGYSASIATTYFNLLAEGGWKFIWGDNRTGFVLSPYLGMGYSVGLGTTTLDYYGVTETVPVGGFVAFIACSLGFGF